MKSRNICFAAALTALGVALFVSTDRSGAQNSSKLSLPLRIQAQAMGTSTQMGRSYNITALINEYSPPEDQGVLLQAFDAKGNEGLVNALSKMPSKGRLAITGTLGGDLAYIRRFDQPDGSIRIRMVTNRLLRFGEVWADTRSTDYNLTGMEVILTKDKNKSSGTLFPAAELKVNKKGQMEIELYQNPWKLVNIQIR